MLGLVDLARFVDQQDRDAVVDPVDAPLPGALETLRATADADLDGVTDTLSGQGDEAQAVMDGIAAAGVDLDDVFAVLEREGVEKFVDSWQELLDSIDGRLREIRG